MEENKYEPNPRFTESEEQMLYLEKILGPVNDWGVGVNSPKKETAKIYHCEDTEFWVRGPKNIQHKVGGKN